MRVAILQITLGSRISGFHLLLKCGPLQIQSQISRANDCITMPGLTRLPETGPLPTERKAIGRATRRAAGSKPLNAGSVCGPTEARAFPPGRGSPQHRALKDARAKRGHMPELVTAISSVPPGAFNPTEG